MKRSASILLVAGILVCAVFLATRRDAAPSSGPAPAPIGGGGARAAPELESSSAAVSGDGRSTVAPLVRETTPGEEAGAGWSVCVLDAIAGEPVVGATVRVLDAPAAFREIGARGVGFDTIEGQRLRSLLASEVTTGAGGCARVADPPEHATVEARSGSDWAFAVVNAVPEGRRLTLRLGHDRELRVLVVDGGGMPVGGVPVAVRRQTDDRPSFTWKWTDTAPEAGVATFLHFQRRLEQGSGWHAVLAFPVRGESPVPVDALTPIEPPVTLTLPLAGKLRIRARAADGSVPDLAGAELRVDAFEGASGGVRVWPDGPWSKPPLGAQGEALVPWIGLGLSVRATLVRDGVELAACSTEGPTRAGEEVACDLEWRGESPRFVTGRFVSGDGRAWPAATVRAHPQLFPTPDPQPPSREVRVDERGRFRLQVDVERPPNGSRAYRFEAPHPDGLGRVLARVALDQDVPPQGLDLGDVLLDHGPPLVSGRVVDSARRPIQDAVLDVHARTVAAGDEFWPRLRTSGSERSDEDGGFALFLSLGEDPPGEELRLTASAPGFVPDPERAFARGERGVEIVLAAAGALAGSLALDPALAPGDVALILRGDPLRVELLHADATFEATGLRPGAYSLEVRRRTPDGPFERDPAVRVDGLLVRAGETCRDPRIQRLRIESALLALRIRVVDRASTPLRNAAVTVVGAGGGRPALSGDDGTCSVRCAALPVDVDVSAFGFARQRLAAVDSDREVVLEAGLPVRLRTNARPSGGAPQYRLEVMPRFADPDVVWRGPAWGIEAAGRISFDERGELLVRMPAAGVYECDVAVTVLGGGVGRGGNVELEPPLRITVLASDTEQVFDLPIPQEAVDDAVAAALR